MSLINALNTYQNIVTLFLTFVLVFVTIFYAWQTYKMNKIAKESAEYGRRPYIMVMCVFDKFHRSHFGVKTKEEISLRI